MINPIPKIPRDEPEGSAKKPLAKTSRELELEQMLKKAVDLIDSFSLMVVKFPELIPDGLNDSMKKRAEDSASKTAIAINEFVVECRDLLEQK